MKRPSAPESQMDLEFDIIGADPSLANAIRRILISEVPSMAIEKVSKILVQLSIPSSTVFLLSQSTIPTTYAIVYFIQVFMYNNTSIIQDEVLSHRLGLIPLRADPRKFEWYKDEKSEEDKLKESLQGPSSYGNAKNALEFELKVRCKNNPEAGKAADDPEDLYIDHKVMTSHIKWIPRKDQILALSGKTQT